MSYLNPILIRIIPRSILYLICIITQIINCTDCSARGVVMLIEIVSHPCELHAGRSNPIQHLYNDM